MAGDMLIGDGPQLRFQIMANLRTGSSDERGRRYWAQGRSFDEPSITEPSSYAA